MQPNAEPKSRQCTHTHKSYTFRMRSRIARRGVTMATAKRWLLLALLTLAVTSGPMNLPLRSVRATFSGGTSSTGGGPDLRVILFIALIASVLIVLVLVLPFAAKNARPSPRICKRCGAVNPKYAKYFCVQCGEPLRD